MDDGACVPDRSAFIMLTVRLHAPKGARAACERYAGGTRSAPEWRASGAEASPERRPSAAERERCISGSCVSPERRPSGSAAPPRTGTEEERRCARAALAAHGWFTCSHSYGAGLQWLLLEREGGRVKALRAESRRPRSCWQVPCCCGAPRVGGAGLDTGGCERGWVARRHPMQLVAEGAARHVSMGVPSLSRWAGLVVVSAGGPAIARR